jgi:uncharacterized protein YdiU (UPF0061 family)
MTDNTSSVAQARANLAEAEASAAKAKREDAEQQLRQTRELGRKHKDELDALCAEVRSCMAKENLERMKAVDISAAIREHEATKPDASDFPTDAELAAWQNQYNALLQKRNAANAKAIDHQRAAAGPRMRAIELDQIVNRLRYRITSLEAVCRGELPGKQWEGGVSPI